MKPTPWTHLPNAQRIDKILAHLKAHPERWAAARGAAWDAAWDAARDAARGAAWDAARGAAWAAARGAARDAAWDAARAAARGAALAAAWGAAWGAAWDAARDAALAAIYALIAWDNCGHLLDLNLGALNVVRSAGSHAAELLYPAVVAMTEKETV